MHNGPTLIIYYRNNQPFYTRTAQHDEVPLSNPPTSCPSHSYTWPNTKLVKLSIGVPDKSLLSHQHCQEQPRSRCHQSHGETVDSRDKRRQNRLCGVILRAGPCTVQSAVRWECKVGLTTTVPPKPIGKLKLHQLYLGHQKEYIYWTITNCKIRQTFQ